MKKVNWPLGTQVRILRTEPKAPPAGSIGEVTYMWRDGMLAVKVSGWSDEYGYWPKDLEKLE